MKEGNIKMIEQDEGGDKLALQKIGSHLKQA